MASPDPRIGVLLEMLDQAYDARAWHGTTLKGALRGLTVRQAQWRPGPRRHCIWELAVHAAYWKYAVRRRLAAEARAGFPRKPSNWPRLPARLTAQAWRADLALLQEQHRALRAFVAAMDPRVLARRSPTGAWSNLQQIVGIAAHDLYHTGQIQLLKRQMRD